MRSGPPTASGSSSALLIVCQGGGFGRGIQIIEIDLAKLFADSEAGTMKPAANYERVRGTIPTNMIAGSDMGLDANEGLACFRVTGDDVGQHLAPGTKIESGFGPRNMGAGPAGLRSMNLKTGEIVFCWETGGKAPQRTRTVMADGTGLRPLYPEAPYEWITHEAVITSNEVAPAILGHRRVGALHAGGDARRCALNGPARLGEFGGRSQSPGAR